MASLGHSLEIYCDPHPKKAEAVPTKKRKAMAVSTATLAKAVPKIPSVVVPPLLPSTMVLLKRFSPRLAVGALTTPPPLSGMMLTPTTRANSCNTKAVWKKHGVANIIEASDRAPTCDSGHVVSHVVMLDFHQTFHQAERPFAMFATLPLPNARVPSRATNA